MLTQLLFAVLAAAPGILPAALVLVAILAVAAAIGCGLYARQRTISSRSSLVAATLLSVIAAFALVYAVQHWPADVEPTDTARQASPQIFNELNFRFDAPAAEWEPVDPARLDADARVAYAQADQHMAFVAIVHAPGIENQIGTETLKETLLAGLRAAFADVAIKSLKSETLAGIPGERLTLEVSGEAGTLRHVVWLSGHRGHTYQLQLWSDRAQAEKLNLAASDLFGKFSVIDPERVVRAGPPLHAFVSPRYGYSVDLSDTPWQPWENVREVAPDAEFGAVAGNYAGCAVIPIALAGREPRLEAVTAALLARFGLRYDSMELRNLHAVANPNGQRFEVTREVAGHKFDYHFQIAQQEGCAWLVAAWANQAAPIDAAPLIGRVFERFKIERIPSEPPALVEMPIRERRSHARFFNDLGLYHFNARWYSDAADCFRQAFETETNDAGFLENLIVAQLELSRHRDAKEYLARHLEKFADHDRLQRLYADLQAEIGETEAATKTYAALFTNGYRDDEAFADYIELLTGSNRLDEAAGEIDRYLLDGDSQVVRRMQAGLMLRRGDHENAISLLLAQQKSRPFDPDIAYTLSEAYFSAGQYRSGLDVCRELVEHRYDTADTYLLKAQHELGLKWYADAKTSLELALAREANDSQAQALLRQVSSILGQGSNSSIKEQITPVAIPSDLLALPAESVAEQYRARYGACCLQRITAIGFSPAKEHKITRRQVIKLLDTSGVTRFSTFQVGFDPVGEQIYVNTLRVTDAEGREIAVGKPSDYYVIDAANDNVATQRKILNVPVPGLQPGHTVEFVVTTRDLAETRHFPYLDHFFTTDIPLIKDIVYVDAADVLYTGHATHDLASVPAGGGAAWIVENPLVLISEPLQAPLTSYVPHLAIGDSSLTWGKLVGNYRESIKDRLTIEPTIRELADQTTRNIANEEDRVAGLARLVQEQLTYKAIEFGSRARMPRNASTVLANRFGDCKDHSLLLTQLLQAAGIDAELALVRTDGDIVETLPSFDQFNHMLVYLPGYRGGQFIDCTDKHAPVEQLVPPGLAGRRALVLGGSEPQFITVPNTGGGNRVESNRSLRIINNADLSIEETLRLDGYLAANLRGLLSEIQPANRAAELQKQLAVGSGGPLQVQKVEIDNLDDKRNPLVIKMTLIAKSKFHSSGDVLIGQIPALWERFFLTADPVEKRQTPFVLRSPLRLKSTVEFVLPEGYVTADMGQMNQEQESQFATWKVAANAEGGTVRANYEATRQSGSFQAEEYAAYCDSMDRAAAALVHNIVLHRSSK